ncbi:MAG: 30S ribosomal protein S9 [Planctomycetota bacterium]|jgi:small subunit ribosomal protein S9
MAEPQNNDTPDKPDAPETTETPLETTAEAPAESKGPTLEASSSEPKYGYWWGTGRRKRSVARVRIRPGDGKLLINKKQLDGYFCREQDRLMVMAPLKTVEAERLFDVFVNVRGGGTSGQSGAVSLGIARALKTYSDVYVGPLRDGGHLTRDSRMVERKKYGQRGARRRFQFSKR